MLENFAVFIITYKRPDTQLTYDTLNKCGYTGKVYFVVDNTDDTIQRYIDNYGADNIIVFDKNYYINSDRYDNCINSGIFSSAVYARRAVEDIAVAKKIQYFAVIDDDIKNFVIRYPICGKLKAVPIYDFDLILSSYVELLKLGIACVGFGNARSYFGGINAFTQERLCDRILITNCYIRNSDVAVDWTSWTLEDDITVFQSSKSGNLWLSIPYVQQVPAPFNDVVSGVGGNIDLYKLISRYKIYFSEILHFPSMTIQCRDFATKEVKLVRKQNRQFQKIVSSRYRKEKVCN